MARTKWFLRWALFALLAASVTTVAWGHDSEPQAQPEAEAPLRAEWHTAAGLEYVVVEPRNLPPDAELPMLVYLHGRGGRPFVPDQSIWGIQTPVRLIVPRGPEVFGEGFAWMPVSAHQGESEALVSALDERTRMLSEAMIEWRRRHPTRGQPILVGFSQGGILAMNLALTQPGSIARSIAMAAWLPPSRVPSTVDPYAMHTPIVALHGSDDSVLSAERTRRLIEDLSQHGYPASYEEFPGVGHQPSPLLSDRLRELLEQALREMPADATVTAGTA